MWRDPIVEEVRRIRERIFAECGYDLERLAERDRKIAQEWTGKLVTREELIRERRSSKAREE